MNKAFSRVNWQNLPSRATALSANNLNRGDSALDVIDDRVIDLYSVKADKVVLDGVLTEFSFNPNTGIIRVRHYNGETETYDTGLSKVAVNFEYDADTRQIILYDAQGHVVDRVDLSDFITVNAFNDSDTIAFDVDGTDVSAEIKKNSITGEYLDPDYLSDIETNAALAQTSAEDAVAAAAGLEDAVKTATSYAVGGTDSRPGEDEDNAKYYAEKAEEYARSEYALTAKSYAVGDTGIRPGEDTDNAKYYSEQAALSTIMQVTATIDDGVGTPSVDVTETSPIPNKSFRFDFHNIKGAPGEQGEIGIGIVDSHIDDNDHLILEYGNGDTIDAGVIGTNIRQMTQDEYMALSDEEKNDDGMYYWITDADGGTMAIIVSGISDYNEMLNKPSINGHELIGDLSLEDLGIPESKLISITQSDFDELTPEEQDDPNIWYWIKEV